MSRVFFKKVGTYALIAPYLDFPIVDIPTLPYWAIPEKTGAIEDMKFLGVIKVLGWFFWLWNFQGVYQKFAKFSGVCPQPSFFRKPTDYRRRKIYESAEN